MRACFLALALLACGRHDVEPPKPTSPATATSATAPLVLVSARDPAVASAARRSIEAAGMRVEDAKPLDAFFGGSLFFGSTEAPPPKGTPPGVAARYTRDIAQCRRVREKCPTPPGGSTCEDVLGCTQTLLVRLREDWLREVGAATWITALSGSTGQRGETFFAQARGHKPCERSDRTLRAGKDLELVMPGSDAPIPATAEDAIELAGELAARIAKGEGSRSLRTGLSWVEQPTTEAEVDAMLGCP